jgi:hypothetical protein
VGTAYAMGIMIDVLRAKGSLTVPKVPNTMGCDTYVVLCGCLTIFLG